MRKLHAWILLLAVLLPAAGWADPVGFGVMGGVLVPVAQDDQGSGSLFGIKIRAVLTGPIMVEPNIHFGSFGDADIEGVGTREGSSLKHYGVDITLGGAIASPGLKPFVFIGGGIYNTKRTGDNTTNKSGWSFGAGFALGVRPDLDIDIRGRFNIASWEGSASKKSVGITLGVTYYAGQY